MLWDKLEDLGANEQLEPSEEPEAAQICVLVSVRFPKR